MAPLGTIATACAKITMVNGARNPSDPKRPRIQSPPKVIIPTRDGISTSLLTCPLVALIPIPWHRKLRWHSALHCIEISCNALHCVALCCVALHCIEIHCVASHCIALHCIGPQDVLGHNWDRSGVPLGWLLASLGCLSAPLGWIWAPLGWLGAPLG